MRFRAAIVLTMGLAIRFTSGAGFAHHSFASEFDNSVAVTVHGVVVSVEMINPHSFIYLDVKSPQGIVERWALEGPGPMQIVRRGLGPEFIKAGDELGACGYLARRDAVPTARESVTGGARRLQAAVLTMPNREKLVWSNYRQRKCGLDT